MCMRAWPGRAWRRSRCFVRMCMRHPGEMRAIDRSDSVGRRACFKAGFVFMCGRHCKLLPSQRALSLNLRKPPLPSELSYRHSVWFVGELNCAWMHMRHTGAIALSIKRTMRQPRRLQAYQTIATSKLPGHIQSSTTACQNCRN